MRPISRALCSRNRRSKCALCATIGVSPTSSATRGSTWSMVSASATISFVMPVNSRIFLGMLPVGRTRSFSTSSCRPSLRITAISMIESRSGLNPVVSTSTTQNTDASPSGSAGSTGRSTTGRRLRRDVKSAEPSASISWMPTVPMPATNPTTNALRTALENLATAGSQQGRGCNSVPTPELPSHRFEQHGTSAIPRSTCRWSASPSRIASMSARLRARSSRVRSFRSSFSGPPGSTTRPVQQFHKRFPSQARVADQRSQETATQLPVSRHGEAPARRPDEDHVASFPAVDRVADPGDRPDEVVSREDRQSNHPRLAPR